MNGVCFAQCWTLGLVSAAVPAELFTSSGGLVWLVKKCTAVLWDSKHSSTSCFPIYFAMLHFCQAPRAPWPEMQFHLIQGDVRCFTNREQITVRKMAIYSL